MNNGVNDNVNNSPTNGTEEIKAAKVYKLTEETKPQAIPERETPAWEKPKEEKTVEQAPVETKIVQVKSKSVLARILFIIVILMGLYIGYSYYTNKITIMRINNMNSPVSTLGEEKKLSLDSTVVLDLYNKVKTNIREDIAESELNDSMKLYLAYRAIPNNDIYESDCYGFDNAQMIPFTCDDKTTTFRPNAFKEETLKVAYKKLFGENATFTPKNIQIGRNCIGGYQYIPSRKEYVQGTCTENVTTTYRVTKELISATSKESTIILKEKVKYLSSEGQTLPETLKNGTYIYTFKLDKNYNYTYVSKILERE